MLTPKRVQHRKWQRGTSKGNETRGTELAFGSFGLKCLQTKWVSAKELEAARRAIIRYLKKGGKVWLRVFPDKPFTAKGPETSMGGGKGSVDHYVFSMRPGRIIFEMEGIPENMAAKALTEAASKLSVKTKLVKK